MTAPILIVEDEPVLRRNLVETLHRIGLAALGAESFCEARRLIEETPPALVCLDIQLAGAALAA